MVAAVRPYVAVPVSVFKKRGRKKSIIFYPDLQV